MNLEVWCLRSLMCQKILFYCLHNHDICKYLSLSLSSTWSTTRTVVTKEYCNINEYDSVICFGAIFSWLSGVSYFQLVLAVLVKKNLYYLFNQSNAFTNFEIGTSIFPQVALYTLLSECIVSILFCIHFLICLTVRASLVGDHFLYSHDLNVWFRGDIVRRN